FKPRPAYRFSAEDSIYLHREAGGKGLGRSLLAELTFQAETAGIRKLIAVIGDSANAASIGVHRALGFSQVGVFKSCGWKFGKWLDIVLMEKSLGEGDTTPPERIQRYGLDDQWSWVLVPFLGFTIAGCALTAIVYGLMSREGWNARFNRSLPEDAIAGATNWFTVGAMVLSLLIGTSVLMASIAFSFQRYFEYQVEEGRKISQ